MKPGPATHSKSGPMSQVSGFRSQMSAPGLPSIKEDTEEIVAVGRVVHETGRAGPHETGPLDGRFRPPVDPQAPGPWMGGFAYPWTTLASICAHALHHVDTIGLAAHALRVVTENQGGCKTNGWMECEAGDLLYCPYGSVWSGSQFVSIAFKYVTGHSRLKFTEHGFVKDVFTTDQLHGSESRVGQLIRINALAGVCPTEGSPATTVKTHRLWQRPSSCTWTHITEMIAQLLAGPVRKWVKGQHIPNHFQPAFLCAVRDAPRQGKLMGLTVGDHILVLDEEQVIQVDVGTARMVVRCCKYWLGAGKSGAIKDYGFCRLSDLEPQRDTDHYPVLHHALHATGSSTGSWHGTSQNGTSEWTASQTGHVHWP